MNRFRISAAVWAALLATAPVSAQDASDPPASEGDDIVVTGERDRAPPSRREVNRQARDISDITSDIYDKPLARIADRLCPGVIGLRQGAAELMIDRIRWNAERLGMWMADDTGCSPNLIVAFV